MCETPFSYQHLEREEVAGKHLLKVQGCTTPRVSDFAFPSGFFPLTHIRRVIPWYNLCFCFSNTLCSMHTWMSLSFHIAVRTISLKTLSSRSNLSKHRICRPQHCLLHRSNLQILSRTGPYVQGAVYISVCL